jgi:hypothetical protein
VSERGTAEWWPGIVCDFLVEIGLLGEARWWDDEYKDLRLHIETAMRQARGEEVVADEQIRHLAMG